MSSTVTMAWEILDRMERAVAKVRDLRPGSVETAEQERAIEAFARRIARTREKPETAE